MGDGAPEARLGTVSAVLAQIAVIPSAPLLVPELAGPDAVDTEAVRAAVLAVGADLAGAACRWVAVGAGTPPAGSPPRSGDFGAYGVAVPVHLPSESGLTEQVPAAGDRLPLPLLLAGWLGARVQPPPREIEPIVVDPSTAGAACAELGARIVRDIAADEEPVGLLVVADGPTALSPRAPGGGERASAWALQHRLEAALRGGDAAALAGLGEAECAAEGVDSRAAWQVLGGALRDLPVDEVDVVYAQAPFGVGYLAATLRPRGGRR